MFCRLRMNVSIWNTWVADFWWGEFLEKKKKSQSDETHIRFPVTGLDGAFYLFIYFLNQGILEVECLLYLYVQCGNTYHLGNEHPTLNMVTIVKHVTSPVCCAPTVCLLHGAEDKTDFSLHWKSVIAGATFFNSVNDCTHSYLIHTGLCTLLALLKYTFSTIKKANILFHNRKSTVTSYFVRYTCSAALIYLIYIIMAGDQCIWACRHAEVQTEQLKMWTKVIWGTMS